LWTAGCGGVMALAVIAGGLVRDLWMRRKSSEDGAPSAGQSVRRAESIPYAPAIAAGVWLSLVGAT
jgi:Flp pilus assembly protein protease CpaA